jgi:hypothetical protein
MKGLKAETLRSFVLPLLQRNPMEQEKIVNQVCQAVKERGSATWDGELSDGVIDGVIAALSSPDGQLALRHLIEEVSNPQVLTLTKWTEANLGPSQPELLTDFKKRVGAALQPVIEHFKGASGNIPAVPSAELAGSGGLAIAASIVKKLAGDYGVPVQAIEILDDLKGLDPTRLEQIFGRTPGDGVIAAALSFAISATKNTSRYNRGQVRWDDAIDSVVGDTIKGGLTGLILSTVAGSLGLAPPLAFAVTIVLAPIVYSVVSAVMDQIYDHMLGGRQIGEARAHHRDYLEAADVIQHELWPRLRKMNQLGKLVDDLFRFDKEPAKRTALRASVRTTLKSLTSPSQTEAEGTELAAKYDGALKTFLKAHKNIFPDVNDKFERMSTREILHLHRAVTEECRQYWNITQKFQNLNVDTILASICTREGIMAERSDLDKCRTALIKAWIKVEKKRPSPEEPLLFETTWIDSADPKASQEEEYVVAASDLPELVHLISVMEGRRWTWKSSLQQPRLKSFKTCDPVAKSTIRPDYSPRTEKVFNKFYVYDLYDGLRAGRYRLFEYRNERLADVAPSYIAVTASDEAPEIQCIRVRTSLQQLNPFFKGSAVPRLHGLKYVQDVTKVNELTLYGLNVYVVDIYTATYKVELSAPMGTYQYVSYEGYFPGYDAAKAGFKDAAKQHILMGVRPGPKVLSDELRHELEATKGEDLYLLQNQLLGRLAEGLIAHDQLANLSEARVARVAGAGVMLFFWWSLSGRVRRELSEALCDAKVQQALRMELMEALIEAQRLHVLQHKFFEQTLYAGFATARLEGEQKAATELESVLGGNLPKTDGQAA